MPKTKDTRITTRQAARPIVKAIKAMEKEEKKQALVEIDQLFIQSIEVSFNDPEVIEILAVERISMFTLTEKIELIFMAANNGFWKLLPPNNIVLRLLKELET